jgi:hypothetical protein
MSDEIELLLEKFGEGDLNPEERRRLTELLGTEAGRRRALACGCPEAVFLAPDQAKPPAWEPFWEGLEARLREQTQVEPSHFPWKPAFAAAAVLVIAMLAFFVFTPGTKAPERNGKAPATAAAFRSETETAGESTAASVDKRETRVFELRNRTIQEVRPKLAQFLSEEKSIRLLTDREGFEITDRPANIVAVSRAWPLLDRPRVDLHVRLQFRYADKFEREYVSTGPVDIERVDLPLAHEVTLETEDGLRFDRVLQGNYRIVCMPQVSDDGSQITFDRIVVTDPAGQLITLTSVRLAPGEWKLVPTGKSNSEGRQLVIALSVSEKD